MLLVVFFGVSVDLMCSLSWCCYWVRCWLLLVRVIRVLCLNCWISCCVVFLKLICWCRMCLVFCCWFLVCGIGCVFVLFLVYWYVWCVMCNCVLKLLSRMVGLFIMLFGLMMVIMLMVLRLVFVGLILIVCRVLMVCFWCGLCLIGNVLFYYVFCICWVVWLFSVC